MWYVSSFNASLRLCIGIALISCITQASMPIALHTQPNRSAVVLAATTNQPIKSYREWKLAMISNSELRVKSLKEALVKAKGSTLGITEAGLNTSVQAILDKEELQFSLAQDLTITDYFVGYLTKQKSVSAAIKEISARLSAEEVAELMTAYADNFFSSKPTPVIEAPRADSGI